MARLARANRSSLTKESTEIHQELKANDINTSQIITREPTIYPPCDSLSTLNSIKNQFQPGDIATKIQNKLYEASTRNKQITLMWIPSHTGIPGNELADQQAKIATLNEEVPIFPTLTYDDIKTLINQMSNDKWLRIWKHQTTKLNTIKSSTNRWTNSSLKRKKEIVLNCMRIGHTRIIHGYLMAKEEAPICDYIYTMALNDAEIENLLRGDMSDIEDFNDDEDDLNEEQIITQHIAEITEFIDLNNAEMDNLEREQCLLDGEISLTKDLLNQSDNTEEADVEKENEEQLPANWVTVSHVVETLPKSIISQLPNIEKISKTIRRERIKQQKPPANPVNIGDLIVSGEYSVTNKGDMFLFYDSKIQKRILIFSTLENLNMLKECSSWFGDGTFRSVPTLFSQLYTIHGTKNKQSFPLVYILMVDRSKDSYIEVLKALKSVVSNLTLRRIMVDFEMAFISAYKDEFPTTEIKSCFFHCQQCLWQKIQSCGLQQMYGDDVEFSMQLRSLSALAFIPTINVIRFFKELIDSTYFLENEELLSPIINYFEDTWIGR
ncbi:hypothetical protein QTP88_027319 [Uroleucon formosanum]